MKPVGTTIVQTDIMTVADRLKTSKFRSKEQEAFLAILVTASHIKNEMGSDVFAGELSQEQYNIMRILRGVYPDGHSCGDISSRMVDNSPDITRRIDALVKKGYATREKSAEDRRVVVTRITQKGLDLLAKLDERVSQKEHVIMNKLSAEECNALIALCEKII